MAPKKKVVDCTLLEGTVLTDTEKKTWRLGQIIGKGGFGVIYLASDCVDAPVREDTDYVIKVEFYENGPLFSELKFYQRAAKPYNIDKWKRDKKLDFLGIPTYWASGHSEYNGTRYRFMVMDRLDTDLQKVIMENGGQLKKQTVLQLGCLVLDVLEYIHENEYVHADIKAANLLLGHRDPGKVYLADYGLSYRYCPNGEHKEDKKNPKKGHNGTIEYTSIDAHEGRAPSRRGDLEVLGYCLLHWQCGTLPWLSMLRNPVQVQEAKAKLIAALPDSVIQMSTSGFTTEVARFLLHVRALGYKEKPDYQALRKVLLQAGPWGPLDLSRPRAVETARPATSRDSSSGRSGRPKLLSEDEDETRAKVKSIPVKVRYRIPGESKTVEQEPWKAIPLAKEPATSRPIANDSNEDDDVDDDDDDDDWLPRVYPKSQDKKQRQKHKQKPAPVSRAMRTNESWLPTRKQVRLRFSSDVSDHWRRKCSPWDDNCTRPNGEEDYWEKSHQNHNHWDEADWDEIDWNGTKSSTNAYEYRDDQCKHNARNMHHAHWRLKIFASVAIVALLVVVFVVTAV